MTFLQNLQKNMTFLQNLQKFLLSALKKEQKKHDIFTKFTKKIFYKIYKKKHDIFIKIFTFSFK